MSELLAVITDDGWQPGLRDQNLAGWLIVAGYFLTMLACWRALRIARAGAALSSEFGPADRRSRERSNAYRASGRLWIILIITFGFLGLNKQLDLQTWLTEIARRVVYDAGWEHDRRIIQAIFVSLIAVGGLAALVGVLYWTRGLLPRHRWGLLGLAVLGVFVVVSASSFHHLDATLGSEFLGLKLRWLLEIVGIVCVGGCALNTSWWFGLSAKQPPALTAAG